MKISLLFIRSLFILSFVVLISCVSAQDTTNSFEQPATEALVQNMISTESPVAATLTPYILEVQRPASSTPTVQVYTPTPDIRLTAKSGESGM